MSKRTSSKTTVKIIKSRDDHDTRHLSEVVTELDIRHLQNWVKKDPDDNILVCFDHDRHNIMKIKKSTLFGTQISDENILCEYKNLPIGSTYNNCDNKFIDLSKYNLGNLVVNIRYFNYWLSATSYINNNDNYIIHVIINKNEFVDAVSKKSSLQPLRKYEIAKFQEIVFNEYWLPTSYIHLPFHHWINKAPHDNILVCFANDLTNIMKFKRSDFLVIPDKSYYCSCYNTEDGVLIADVTKLEICRHEYIDISKYNKFPPAVGNLLIDEYSWDNILLHPDLEEKEKHTFVYVIRNTKDVVEVISKTKLRLYRKKNMSLLLYSYQWDSPINLYLRYGKSYFTTDTLKKYYKRYGKLEGNTFKVMKVATIQEAIENVKQSVHEMDDMFTNYATRNDNPEFIVYRGMSKPYEFTDPSRFSHGHKSIILNSFTSTTKNLKAAEIFSVNNQNVKVVAEIFSMNMNKIFVDTDSRIVDYEGKFVNSDGEYIDLNGNISTIPIKTNKTYKPSSNVYVMKLDVGIPYFDIESTETTRFPGESEILLPSNLRLQFIKEEIVYITDDKGYNLIHVTLHKRSETQFENHQESTLCNRNYELGIIESMSASEWLFARSTSVNSKLSTSSSKSTHKKKRKLSGGYIGINQPLLLM